MAIWYLKQKYKRKDIMEMGDMTEEEEVDEEMAQLNEYDVFPAAVLPHALPRRRHSVERPLESLVDELTSSKSMLNLMALAGLDHDDGELSVDEERDVETIEGQGEMVRERSAEATVTLPEPGSQFYDVYYQLLSERELMEEGSVTCEQFSMAVQQCVKRCLTMGDEGIAFIQQECSRECFPYIFIWASTMTSEEHRAAIYLIDLLISNLPLLSGVLEGMKEQLTFALRFLIAISPQPQCARTKVKRLALAASKALVEHGLASADRFVEPFYGPGLPVSSAYTDLMQLPNTLYKEWDDYWASLTNEKTKQWMKELDDRAASRLEATREKGWDSAKGIALVNEWDMFKVLGDGHPPPKVWGKWGEEDGVDDLYDARIDTANKLMQMPPEEMMSIKSIMDMHKCFNVDEDVDKAAFRREVTVGSYQYYSQYRVFMPHQEIPTAFTLLLETANSERMRQAHPIVQALYIYSGLVYFVHPFEDGNGRMARLLSNLVLKREGYDFALSYKDKVVPFKDYVSKVLATR